MLFQTQSNVLFRLFRLLTAQVGSNLVIICTNSLDCYNYRIAPLTAQVREVVRRGKNVGGGYPTDSERVKGGNRK